MVMEKGRRRTSAEKAADDAMRERYKMLTGKQRIHSRVIPCPDDAGRMNAKHYTLERDMGRLSPLRRLRVSSSRGTVHVACSGL